MLEQLTNQYSLSKTLRFRLKPMGETLSHIEAKQFLETDKARLEDYKAIKKVIDDYHRTFIEDVLSNMLLPDLTSYRAIYTKRDKDDKDKKELEKIEQALRKEIIKAFKEDERFSNIFKKELIEKDLLELHEGNHEITALLSKFKGFTTYFTGFHENRKNMYSAEDKATAIPYRIINENLPKFIDNLKVYEKMKVEMPEQLSKLNRELSSLVGISVDTIFRLDSFSSCLSQKGIQQYNDFIGGYSTEDGQKIQGVNEYINEYIKNSGVKLPLMKPLFKQILSDRKSLSFVDDQFESDDEVYNSVEEVNTKMIPIINRLEGLINSLDINSNPAIFVANNTALTTVSNHVFGSWDAVSASFKEEFTRNNLKKNAKITETFINKRDKAFKSKAYFSLDEIQSYGNSLQLEDVEVKNVVTYFKDEMIKLVNQINESYQDFNGLFNNEKLRREQAHQNNVELNSKELSKNDDAVAIIKTYLDNVKALQWHIKLLQANAKDVQRNEAFYVVYDELFGQLNEINALYNKVRNYVTQKPFSQDKIKLNFNRSTLLAGWDKNKEANNLGVILLKETEVGTRYYLGIMDRNANKSFIDIEDTPSNDCYQKMVYKYLPGPNKMLPKVFLSQTGQETYHPSQELLENYDKKTHIKGDNFNQTHCHTLINYFKSCLESHPDYQKFEFKFSPTESYEDISKFYREVAEQGYKITYDNISTTYIDTLVREGELYLFEIYNKDFSTYSKGTPNLHTLYFKALFEAKNLENIIYKLNGEAEIFYRKASINHTKPTHERNVPMNNKNPKTEKKQTTLPYDLYKDKRYAEDQMFLHLPITMNFKPRGRENINDKVRELIKDASNQHIIGIDRGERNLIYVTVQDTQGNLLEQKSFNIIENEKTIVDYHQMLAKKEDDRKKARQNWSAIENIKELKSGYLSQVIHEICKLVVKYDAIIAMEDLNMGFKNTRTKFERQVYQKFEQMLINKLNYYVDKSKQAEDYYEAGGLYHAYQVTNKFLSFEKLGKQSGIIFYVPPYLTSKIDPVTGFVNLMDCRYKNMEQAKLFIEKLTRITYNEAEAYFEFDIDYKNYERGSESLIKNWTICSYGDRIESFRNPEKNNKWDTRTILLTDEFKVLFNEYQIDIKGDIKAQCQMQTESKFFKTFLHLFKLTVQLRNSRTNIDEKGNQIILDPVRKDDYIVSPIKNQSGTFYDSRVSDTKKLPQDADANGAYHIAKKAHFIIEQLQKANDVSKVKTTMKNSEWLAYAQLSFKTTLNKK